MKPRFILIAGPSASGKTRIAHTLLKKHPSSTKLITTTTRQPRAGEIHGRDYFFVSREEFEKGIREGGFLEYADVYGNLYGSSRKSLEDAQKKFDHVFAVIDVQGVRSIKSTLPEAFSIFIRPGSLEEIRQRLIGRKSDLSAEELDKRMMTAEHELSLAPTFDAVIENIEGRFDETIERIAKIIESE